MSAAQSGGARRAALSVAVPTGRDGRGRFVAGQRADGSPVAAPGEKGGSGGAMGRLSDSIGRLSQSLTGADNIDPTVNAVKEVTDVITPLGRGLFSMFGRSAERKKERWYQRIWQALTKPVVTRSDKGGRGGGILGGLGGMGGMLGAVPRMLMTLLSRILLPIAAAWGAWELGKWIGGKIYDWLDRSGWNAKLFDAVDSIKATFSGAWTAVGNGIDSFVGGIKSGWQFISDGFKNVFDGLLMLPKKLGEFFAGIDAAIRKIPVIGDAYGAAVDGLKTIVKDAKQGFAEGAAGRAAPAVLGADGRNMNDPRRVDSKTAVGGDGRAFNDPRRVDASELPPATSMSQAIGRDVGRAARGAGAMAGKAAGYWNGGAKSDIVSAASKSGVDAGLLAQIAHFESGFNKDAAPITKGGTRLSSAHGYGQFLDGTWVDMVKQHGEKYGVANAGRLSKADALALRGDTKLQAGMLAEYTKENATKGRALGGTDDAASVYALHNLGGGDGSKLLKALKANPGAPVSSILSGKVIGNNKSLYGDGSISVRDAYGRMGEKMRSGEAFAVDARKAQLSGTLPATTVAGMRIPAMPVVPSSVPAQLPDQAKNEVPDRLNSGAAGSGKVNVSIKDKLTQNVGDRGVAHITTGGIGG